MSTMRPFPAAVQARHALLLIERLHKELVRAIDWALEPEKLSLAEWLIVAELAEGEAPLTRIARDLARDPGSLSRITSRLIQRGFLESARHDYDRRRATLSLTAKGFATLDRVAAAMSDPGWRDSAPKAPPVGRILSLFDTPYAGTAASPMTRGRPDRRNGPKRHGIHASTQENDP
jgi:DNA-binding MarR family transcriptional regulator